MATNRAGTGQWKRLRARKLSDAEQHQPLCPYCGTHLDYLTSGRPNSPELDHIIPWSKGGQDTDENTLIVCSHCNRSKGNGKRDKKGERKTFSVGEHTPSAPRTSRQW